MLQLTDQHDGFPTFGSNSKKSVYAVAIVTDGENPESYACYTSAGNVERIFK